MDYSSSYYFPIIHLPAELKRRTASYLCPYDALRLSETCHNLHSSLSLRLLRDSRQLFTRQRFTPNATNNGDEVLPWVRIPCLSRRVHSITVTFRWRDQGWGHHKGQVYIVGNQRHNRNPSLPFHGGRVVCTSAVAPHQEEACKLTFSTCSMEGETYQMWYKVGGGGGHQLLLSDGRIHTVLFDDEAGNFSRNYKILKDVGAIAVHPEAEVPQTAMNSTFYPQLLLRVSRTIRLELALRTKRNKQKCCSSNNTDHTSTEEDEDEENTSNQYHPHPLESNPLVSFFQMFRIPVTEDSLSAVEEIIQCESDEQALTQDSSVPPAPPPAEGGFLDDFRDLLVGVGMEFFPADPARRQVVRLNMQPLRAEIEVQQVVHEDDMSDDTTNEGEGEVDGDEDHGMIVDHEEDGNSESQVSV